MNIITRRAFLKSSTVMPTMVGPACALHQYKDGRYTYRKTARGLVEIEWVTVEPGDAIVVMDWTDGRLTSISEFVAMTPPYMDRDGQPVEAEHFHEIRCVV